MTTRDDLLEQVDALRDKGEARKAIELLGPYVEEHPEDADISYLLAALYDSSGQSRAALPHYERALAGDLLDEDYIEASIGYGSSLRALGEYEQSVAVLERAFARRPDNRAVETFLAMARFNNGDQVGAFQTLLRILAEASANQDIRAYNGALSFYADDITFIYE